ncbi:hypothetical protein ACP70R_016196 [Stipagrostis hirtigluma subsp. patula]
MEMVHGRGAIVFCAGVATLLLPPAPAPFGAAAATIGAGRNCTRNCGIISIPYPFGVEPGCYHAAGFNLTCRHGHHGHGPPQPFLGDGTMQVLEISIPNATVSISSHKVEFADNDRTWGQTVNGTWGGGLPRGGPYFLSGLRNSLTVIGCDVQVDLRGGARNDLIGSCTTVCPPSPGPGRDYIIGISRECTGIGCCQADIIIGYSFYHVQIHELNRSLADGLKYSVYVSDDVSRYIDIIFPDQEVEALPAQLNWVINTSTCPTNMSAPECRSDHSTCVQLLPDAHGYVCSCSDGYQGNPYVPGGCQDIDECKSPDIYVCHGNCKNTPGSFICQCPSGYIGNASVADGCRDIDECEHAEAHSCYGLCLNFPGSFQCQCPNGTYGNPLTKGGCITIKNSFTGLGIGLGVGTGTCLLLLALGGPFIVRKIKIQKVKKMKQKFFNQNHGLLLQQLISRNTDIGERMIITLTELEKATNNFDRAHVAGGGGHGVVFKGILDLQVVAIKKSKIVVQREIDEFINEVVVLSQVNHTNVVKLLGCCLETEVPLLVYEFISNGTLYHHLHIEGPISLPWDDRIRIAMEVARAVSYLHSSTSIPIFHRDIKSPNILLDNNLTAKVSDFGASRYIPIDQTGVTTAVQGTFGYLDPSYYYTG